MASSLAQIYIHLTFGTKHRKPMIQENIEPELYPYIASVFRELDSPSIAINGTSDHVHSLFRLSKTIALCDVVEEVKKRSSKWIKHKDECYKDFYWHSGYGAFSVSQSGVEKVKKYIYNQKEHHRKHSFEDEFIGLLKKYSVEYDERYLWI